MLWRRTRRSPIGVEVTRDAVRLLQLEWRADRGRVSACAEVLKPQGDEDAPGFFSPALVAGVRKALRENPFRGRQAVINLPSDQTILRHVKVESTKGQALHDALLFELEDAFPGDTPLVQHLEVGEVMERGERRHELILLAAGQGQINEFVQMLGQAGLEPRAIDAEGCALIRCFTKQRRRNGDRDAHMAIVNLGETATLMTIAGDDAALFMKQLPLGAGQLIETIQKRLDLTREDLRYAVQSEGGEEELAEQITSALRLQIDALSVELSACLRYHAASRRSANGVELVLCGVGAAIPGLASVLSESLDMVVHRPDPFSLPYTGVDANPRLAREFGAWSVPLGLALKEVG